MPRAQFLKKNAWLLRLVSEEAPSTAGDRSEAVRAFCRRWYLGGIRGWTTLLTRMKPLIFFTYRSFAHSSRNEPVENALIAK